MSIEKREPTSEKKDLTKEELLQENREKIGSLAREILDPKNKEGEDGQEKYDELKEGLSDLISVLPESVEDLLKSSFFVSFIKAYADRY